MARAILFAASLSLLAGSAQALEPAVPPGYFIDAAQLSAARPTDRVEAEGDFTLSIHRRYKDAIGAHLLGIAESLYPPREAIIVRAIERECEMGSDTSGVSLWWQDGMGIARVPYAVTSGALAYYTDLTDRFRAHNFRGAWDHNLFWSDLKYEASIERHDVYHLADTTLTNVYVAELSLAWSFDDGTFVPVSLAHRFVVLARDGTVLNVTGDGYTDEQVSMSTHRGIGRVENQHR